MKIRARAAEVRAEDKSEVTSVSRKRGQGRTPSASKPSEHPPSRVKISKGLGGNIGCRQNFFMVPNGFPNVTTSGQQYNIGEKPSVILYTVHLHKSPCRDTKTTILSICLGVPDYSK